MTTQPAHQREWFTPVWVVPLLLIVLVALYAIAKGGIPGSAPAIVPPGVGL
jgi:hypothetical protein